MAQMGGGGGEQIPHSKLLVRWGPEKGCYFPHSHFKFHCEKSYGGPENGYSVQFSHHSPFVLKTTMDLWEDLFFLTILFPTLMIKQRALHQVFFLSFLPTGSKRVAFFTPSL
jgi:hypothetical protein